MLAVLSPEVQSIIIQIVIGSTVKGFLTGLFAGFIANRTDRTFLAIIAGLALGLVLSFIAAYLAPDPTGQHYYLEIMLPGAALGAVAGYSSQRFGQLAV